MIPKFLSCEIKPSDIDVDLECLLLNEVGSYEKIINELIYDIHEELSVEWDDIWSFDDVVERFDKGEILWLVLKDNKPISCSWVSLKTRDDLFIYNSWFFYVMCVKIVVLLGGFLVKIGVLVCVVW